jgi:hypothetical protein
LSPTFKESTFFKNIPEWDGSKWMKESEGKGKGDGDIITIEDDKVVQVRLPWQAIARDVRKTKGKWEYLSNDGTWKDATKKQIAKINKSYK